MYKKVFNWETMGIVATTLALVAMTWVIYTSSVDFDGHDERIMHLELNQKFIIGEFERLRAYNNLR